MLSFFLVCSNLPLFLAYCSLEAKLDRSVSLGVLLCGLGLGGILVCNFFLGSLLFFPSRKATPKRRQAGRSITIEQSSRVNGWERKRNPVAEVSHIHRLVAL